MLCDHNTGQGHLSSPGEKVQTKKSWFRAAIHILGQIFAKNAKNDQKTLFEASKSVKKNKIRKITVKSRNDVKSGCFWHVLCNISAIFEDIDLTFCTHIQETLPSHICYGFLKKNVHLGGTISKRKKWTFVWIFFRNFQNFENPG